MITQHGPRCDVCGHYILPGMSTSVNPFSVAQIADVTLHADDGCKTAVLACGGDWTQLPHGPLREAYERATSTERNVSGR